MVFRIFLKIEKVSPKRPSVRKASDFDLNLNRSTFGNRVFGDDKINFAF